MEKVRTSTSELLERVVVLDWQGNEEYITFHKHVVMENGSHWKTYWVKYDDRLSSRNAYGSYDTLVKCKSAIKYAKKLNKL